jgi:acetyl-CoA synthetase
MAAVGIDSAHQLETHQAADAVPPTMPDYERALISFSWQEARRALAGLPGGRGLNMAHEAVDRHASSDRAGHVALRCLSATGARREVTFEELARLTARFANLLAGLGVAAGERVFVLLERSPELFIAALGTLKARCIFAPLYSAFGPEPIAARVAIAGPRVLVTSQSLFRRRLAEIRPMLCCVEHVLVVTDESGPRPEGTLDFHEQLARAADHYEIGDTRPEDPALLHFTSGTTGKPKGAIHAHEAVLQHLVTGRLALDLHPDDVFWCTADPGWVTGTSYGILAPLANGVTTVVDEGGFDAQRWYHILQEERVTVWYTAPTAIRMLMRHGVEAAIRFDTSRLRFLASVGEPLNPDAVVWGREAFGHPFHDNWWQTETGGIMIANLRAFEVRPGSMGRPLPGVEAAIVAPGEDGRLHVVEDPERQGEIAIRPGWPAMFRGYWGEQARYEACFRDGWYLTGDLARRDAEGYFWFVGRKDDVIKTSGHLVGPFEVESVLLEHGAVGEAGVIGKPDPDAHELIKAFVTLKPGFTPTEALRLELLGFTRKRLGSAIAPKEIAFVDRLPQTQSGKIMRRLLKARELGLEPGDLSTLEPA